MKLAIYLNLVPRLRINGSQVHHLKRLHGEILLYVIWGRHSIVGEK
jgi:hypothetical protein